MHGFSPVLQFDIDYLCRRIKSYGFNLRISMNMTSTYDSIIDVEEDMIIRVELAPGAVHSGADVSAVPVEEPPSDNR